MTTIIRGDGNYSNAVSVAFDIFGVEPREPRRNKKRAPTPTRCCSAASDARDALSLTPGRADNCWRFWFPAIDDWRESWTPRTHEIGGAILSTWPPRHLFSGPRGPNSRMHRLLKPVLLWAFSILGRTAYCMGNIEGPCCNNKLTFVLTLNSQICPQRMGKSGNLATRGSML